KLADAQEEEEAFIESIEALEARQEDVRYEEDEAHDKWQRLLGSLEQQQQAVNESERELALAQQAYKQIQQQAERVAAQHRELQQEQSAHHIPALADLEAAQTSLRAAQQQQSQMASQQAQRQQQMQVYQQQS